jgi:nickel-dependent lactate racemase
LNYLNAYGLRDKRLLLLTAYGAHRRHTPEENETFYGKEALSRVKLFRHDCRDESQLVRVGTTGHGTTVRLNRRYLEAAMSIVLTSVTFHYFAGFGGGRKAVFPGLASEDGILNNHRIFAESAGDSLSRILSFKGNLDDNPLNQDLMEAVAMAPPSFVVNFCFNPEGELSGVFAGNWKESHREACQFLLGTVLPLKRKYDLVIASCGGHPKDINFIQTHKTIDNAFDFVKPGGALLAVAYCQDGIGSESFLQWFEHEDASALRTALLQSYSMNGGTALSLKVKADRSQIYLYSSLDRAVTEKMGLRPVSDIGQSLEEILGQNRVSQAAVLPEGAVTVARQKPDIGGHLIA